MGVALLAYVHRQSCSDDDHQTNNIGYRFDVELYRVTVPCIVHVVGACHVAGVVYAMWLPRGSLEALCVPLGCHVAATGQFGSVR